MGNYFLKYCRFFEGGLFVFKKDSSQLLEEGLFPIFPNMLIVYNIQKYVNYSKYIFI